MDLANGIHPYRTLISLRCDDAQAAIYFTLDGTTPSQKSKRYVEPIRLTSATTNAQGVMELRAVAMAPELLPSTVVSATFQLPPGLILHFKKPPSWPDAFVHYWSTQPSNLNTTWPGEPMTPEEDGWYFFFLPGQTLANVVFNASGNPRPQTQDLQTTQEDWFEGTRTDGNPARLFGAWWGVDATRFNRFAFPGGRYKALVMSFDDGNWPDRDLVSLFNEHGNAGTFHLNSGKLGLHGYVATNELPALYAGHEVSTHSVDHPYLSQLPNISDIEYQLLTDRTRLETWSGQSVRGHSYPFGDYDNRVLQVLHNSPIVYARVVPSTGTLSLPPDLYRWEGSCHHTGMDGLADTMLAWERSDMALLFVWGHAWELFNFDDQNKVWTTPNEHWARMDAFCQKMGNRQDIWYATALELADYLNAIRGARFSLSNDSVHNPSGVGLWIEEGTGVVEIPPGATFPSP